MKAKTSLFAILSIATILGLGSATSVQAGADPVDLLCAGSFNAGGAIFDNVEVVPGASCIIINAIILGNFQSDGGVNVGPNNSVVLGDVQIKNSSGIYGVVASVIAGNVQLEDNPGVGIVFTSDIIGDLQCQKNAVPVIVDGATVVVGNTECP